jgi:hypothetical protein
VAVLPVVADAEGGWVMTATYVKAKDVRPDDLIDVDLLNGCPSEGTTVRVAQVRLGRDGTVEFWEGQQFSSQVTLFHYARPNVKIPVVRDD